VRLWRVSDGKLLHLLEGGNFGCFSPDESTLAGVSLDNAIRLWRVSDGKLVHTLAGHTEAVQVVAFSPDGKILASGSEDKTVRLWEVK
jgi:WD40 repeat protein